MTNYICINGKKAELTEEQLKALGIELPKKKTPFDRVNENQNFYYIGSDGEVGVTRECLNGFDAKCFSAANYCTDKSILEQRRLHEILNRLLWRFSMENKDEENAEEGYYYYIYCPCGTKKWGIDCYSPDSYTTGDIMFDTKEIAERAIKEIAEPFMAEHPDFKLFY